MHIFDDSKMKTSREQFWISMFCVSIGTYGLLFTAYRWAGRDKEGGNSQEETPIPSESPDDTKFEQEEVEPLWRDRLLLRKGPRPSKVMTV